MPAVARDLAGKGAHVIVADRDEDGARTLVNEIGGDVWVVDLSEAPFLLIRSALPYMYGRSFGRIINVSSIHGLRASANKSAYVTAKYALEGLSETTALEGGHHGVTSNCVNPAYVRTPLVEKQIADQARVHGFPESDVVAKVMLADSALDRLVEPHEVTAPVSFLAGNNAAMVTGPSHTMDGGWSAR